MSNRSDRLQVSKTLRWVQVFKVTEPNSDSFDWMTHSTYAILYSPLAKWDVLNFSLIIIRLSTFK